MKPRMPRRLVLSAVIGLLAVAGLAGCRIEQGAAVFVGDTRISDSEVNEVVDSIPVELITSDLSTVSKAYGGIRNQVLEALTVVELGHQVAADTGRQIDADALANAREGWMQRTGLDADNALVSLMAEAEGYRAMLREGAVPEAPTPADVEDAAANVAAVTGQPLNDAELGQLEADLSSPQGQELIGQNRQISGYVAEYGVTPNPKYGQFAIVTFLNARGIPLLTVPVSS